jgi:hypothetical protein
MGTTSSSITIPGISWSSPASAGSAGTAGAGAGGGRLAGDAFEVGGKCDGEIFGGAVSTSSEPILDSFSFETDLWKITTRVGTAKPN